MNKNEYEDLENLIYRGFLTKSVKIHNISFVFKTLNENEFRRVRLMSGLINDKKYTLNYYINYLFLSIYMINGFSILPIRDSLYLEVCSVFKVLPGHLIKSIYDKLVEVLVATNKNMSKIESFCYGTESRYSWLYRRGTPLNSTLNTGILGTDYLGLNQFQEYWSFYNQREDQKEKFQENYSLAKFLASFTDSKAVRKIDSTDKTKEKEETRKRDLIRQGYSEDEQGNIYFNPADTKEGILEELEKQMKGNKDDHDKAIEKYETSLKAGMLNQLKEMSEIKEKHSQNVELYEESRPISNEELVARIEKRKNKEPILQIYEDTNRHKGMSNVQDSDLIEAGIVTKEDYDKISSDFYDKQDITSGKRVMSGSDNVDFPNLKGD